MAKKSTMMPLAIIVLGGGIGFWWWNSRDKTPVGLVVTNAMHGGRGIGENADGKSLTAGAVEGTWRKDENSLSIISESAEKPLLVVYADGMPIHAELITISEWNTGDGAELPDECGDDANTEECGEALTKIYNDAMEKWRKFAKDAGATDASLEGMFATQEESTQSQDAESIYGPMLSLQSHFVW